MFTIFIFLCTHLFGNFSTYKTSSVFLEKNLIDLPISSWKNPTLNDYMLIQRQLYINVKKAIEVPISERGFFSDPRWTADYGWVVFRMGRLRLIDERNPFATDPKFEIIHFNENAKAKEKCIVCYLSYPVPSRNYVNIENIIKALKKIDFDGDLIYRIGGWPNPEKERLKFADVPYSFKPFMIEEARDLGYENILWLDVCALPIKNLDPIFNHMRENGFCFFPSYPGKIPKVLLDVRLHVKNDLGLLGKTIYYDYRDVCSRVVGFNVKHHIGSLLLDHWISAAERKDAFFTGNADQTVLCNLVNGLDLYEAGELPIKYFHEGNVSKLDDIPDHVLKSKACFYFAYELIDIAHSEKKLLGTYRSLGECIDLMIGQYPQSIDGYISNFYKLPKYIYNYFNENPCNH